MSSYHEKLTLHVNRVIQLKNVIHNLIIPIASRTNNCNFGEKYIITNSWLPHNFANQYIGL